MSPSDISNSTLLFPLSRVRSPSLDNPPDHSAFREESLNPWPSKVVSHSLPRDPVSPCLKLHHPENRSPSAHHKLHAHQQSRSQTYLFVLSLYSTLCPHSLHRIASPFFSCTLALHSPQRYCVEDPKMSVLVVLKLELAGWRVGGA